MKRSEWEKYLDGFYIVDCAIRSNDIAYILAVKDGLDDQERELWHVISWAPVVFREDNKTIGRSEFFNLRPTPRIAVEFTPEERYILCDTGGYCWIGRQGESYQPGLMEQMRTIGDEVYLLNSFSLSKRNGHTDEWEELELHPLIIEDYDDETSDRRFLLIDFDAFSSGIFYLLDWKGKVFYQRYDAWDMVDLTAMGYPNLQTEGICCGPDGWVYIFGKDEKGGKIFQGKGDQWKVIWTSSFEIYHIDFESYQDHVIISNNFLFSKIKDGKVEPIENTPFSPQFVSVRDNLLMIASSEEAAIFDGKEWRVIISPYFDENAIYNPQKLTFTPDELNIISQLEYASSEEGEKELAAAKEFIESLDDETLNRIRKKMYEAAQKAKNKG